MVRNRRWHSRGLPLADEPISAAAGGDGTIFVAVETAVADAPDAGQSDPGSVILVRDMQTERGDRR